MPNEFKSGEPRAVEFDPPIDGGEVVNICAEDFTNLTIPGVATFDETSIEFQALRRFLGWRTRLDAYDLIHHAWMSGAYAAGALHAVPLRDCPYWQRSYRMAWLAGFDLARRMDAAIALVLPPMQDLFEEFTAYIDDRVERGDLSGFDRIDIKATIGVWIDWLYTRRNGGALHRATEKRNP